MSPPHHSSSIPSYRLGFQQLSKEDTPDLLADKELRRSVVYFCLGVVALVFAGAGRCCQSSTLDHARDRLAGRVRLRVCISSAGRCVPSSVSDGFHGFCWARIHSLASSTLWQARTLYPRYCPLHHLRRWHPRQRHHSALRCRHPHRHGHYYLLLHHRNLITRDLRRRCLLCIRLLRLLRGKTC
jgi:hypothetical protein